MEICSKDKYPMVVYDSAALVEVDSKYHCIKKIIYDYIIDPGLKNYKTTFP